MLALDVRHLELGIVTGLTAAAAALALATAAVAVPRSCPASAPAMPAPSPEPIAGRVKAVVPITCNDPLVQTVVFTGRVHALGEGIDTLHFQFAEMPRGYTVMTGPRGEFEIRIPRSELGIIDLCSLPTSGKNAAFHDGQLSLQYAMQFER